MIMEGIVFFLKEILVINNNCDASWRVIMHEENLVFVDIKNNLAMWMYSALQVLIFFIQELLNDSLILGSLHVAMINLNIF